MELLISLSLMGILLMTIFGFFMQSKKIEAKFLKAQEIVSSREHFQVKLSHALSGIIPLQAIYKKLNEPHSSIFVNEDGQLCLYFDNGIDPEPRLSGPVMAKLWLNEPKQLVFTIFSLDEDPAIRSEIIEQDIEELSFRFFGALPKKQEDENPTPEYFSSWPANVQINPSMVTISLREKADEKPHEFAFFLSSLETPITYREKSF